MSKQVQFRRGTTAEHSTFTGAVGEITVDTTKNTVVVHDGSTVGGFPLLTTAHAANAITGLASTTTSLTSGGTGVQGTSTTVARADHTHTLPAYPTTLPASDVYAWAKASTKPTYSFSEIGSKPTTISGYGITDAYTKTESNAALSLKANDSTVVHKTGDETKAGVLTLADGLKLQGQNVSPFSGFKNYIINGNFDVDQYSRLPLTSTMSNGACIDNWRYANYGTGTLTMSMDTIMYGGVTYKSLKATATTVMQDLSTIYGHYTSIEDKNCYHLVNKPFTVSFLCEVSHAGNYSLNIRKVTDSSSIDVTYVKLIPLVVGVNRVEVSVPANASYISPNSTNGRGLNICFGINAGTSATNTDEGWVAGNWAGHANTFKWWAIAGAYIKIAQVQLEEGSVATPFEQRPYGLELSLCQRYYEVSSYLATNLISQSPSFGGGIVPWVFKQTKRITPTIGFVQNIGTKVAVTYNITANGTTFVPSTQASSVSDYLLCLATASAEL